MTTSVNSLPRPVSADNAKKIIGAYESFIPTAINSVNTIAPTRLIFAALQDGPSLKEELIDSSCICGNFNGALQSITPPDMVDALNTMVRSIETARAKAIPAFS